MCFLYEYACFRLLSEVALEANETILTASYLLLYVMTTGNILVQAVYTKYAEAEKYFYVNNPGVFQASADNILVDNKLLNGICISVQQLTSVITDLSTQKVYKLTFGIRIFCLLILIHNLLL